LTKPLFSDNSNTYFQWLIAAVAVLAIFLVTGLSQPKLRAKLKDAATRLPLLGVWIIEAETARWAAMMGTLLGCRNT
jgi:general secretion pathway protein F